MFLDVVTCVMVVTQRLGQQVQVAGIVEHCALIAWFIVVIHSD